MQYVEVRSRELLELMGNFFGQRRFPHTAAQQRARDGQPPLLGAVEPRGGAVLVKVVSRVFRTFGLG
jgi:hypothetical protein